MGAVSVAMEGTLEDEAGTLVTLSSKGGNDMGSTFVHQTRIFSSTVAESDKKKIILGLTSLTWKGAGFEAQPLCHAAL